MTQLDLRREDDVRRLRTFLNEISGQIGIDDRASRPGAETWHFGWTERRLLTQGAAQVFIPVEVSCQAGVDGTMSFELEHVVSRHPKFPLAVNGRVSPVAWGARAMEVRRMLDEATLRLLDRRPPDATTSSTPSTGGGTELEGGGA